MPAKIRGLGLTKIRPGKKNDEAVIYTERSDNYCGI